MHAAPAPLFHVNMRLIPLQSRLDDDTVIAIACPVNPALADPQDPRIVDVPAVDAFNRILRQGQPLVLIEWPDLTLAWVWLPFGGVVADALLAGYRDGRSRLESIHLQHDAPAGSA